MPILSDDYVVFVCCILLKIGCVLLYGDIRGVLLSIGMDTTIQTHKEVICSSLISYFIHAMCYYVRREIKLGGPWSAPCASLCLALIMVLSYILIVHIVGTSKHENYQTTNLSIAVPSYLVFAQGLILVLTLSLIFSGRPDRYYSALCFDENITLCVVGIVGAKFFLDVRRVKGNFCPLPNAFSAMIPLIFLLTICLWYTSYNVSFLFLNSVLETAQLTVTFVLQEKYRKNRSIFSVLLFTFYCSYEILRCAFSVNRSFELIIWVMWLCFSETLEPHDIFNWLSSTLIRLLNEYYDLGHIPATVISTFVDEASKNPVMYRTCAKTQEFKQMTKVIHTCTKAKHNDCANTVNVFSYFSDIIFVYNDLYITIYNILVMSVRDITNSWLVILYKGQEEVYRSGCHQNDLVLQEFKYGLFRLEIYSNKPLTGGIQEDIMLLLRLQDESYYAYAAMKHRMEIQERFTKYVQTLDESKYKARINNIIIRRKFCSFTDTQSLTCAQLNSLQFLVDFVDYVERDSLFVPHFGKGTTDARNKTFSLYKSLKTIAGIMHNSMYARTTSVFVDKTIPQYIFGNLSCLNFTIIKLLWDTGLDFCDVSLHGFCENVEDSQMFIGIEIRLLNLVGVVSADDPRYACKVSMASGRTRQNQKMITDLYKVEITNKQERICDEEYKTTTIRINFLSPFTISNLIYISEMRDSQLMKADYIYTRSFFEDLVRKKYGREITRFVIFSPIGARCVFVESLLKGLTHSEIMMTMKPFELAESEHTLVLADSIIGDTIISLYSQEAVIPINMNRPLTAPYLFRALTRN